MKALQDSLPLRLLRKLARFVSVRQWLFLYPQIILFVFCVFYTVKNLEFDTSRNNLVGSDKKYHQNFLEFKKEFPTQDDLVVVVESEATEKNRQFVERLGAKLEAETNFFSDVFFKGDLKMMGPKALLFVPEHQLKELHQTLRDYRPFINQFTRATNLNALFSLINTQFRYAKNERNAENESMVKALPALERIISQATESLKRPGTPPSPGLNALFGAGEEAEREMYITFNSGKLYLVTTRASDEKKTDKSVEKLRQLVRETQVEVTGLNVGITGEPILEYDEMAQSQKDSTLASIVSLLLCVGIFIYSYRDFRRPLKATFCLLIGLGYTMAFTTLVVGHLNILTITFVPILIGLAIDFGVHLITRYEEELRRNETPMVAIERAVANTGLGIIAGAFTTAGAFFAMAATDFKGIQEMGIICGGGMLLCLIPMMTLLPVLLLRGKQQLSQHPKSNRRERIEKFWLYRPILVSVITAVICVAAISQFGKVYFDYNLLNMQSKGLPAVEYEHKLIDSASKSVLFAAVVATNLPQALALEAKIKTLNTNIVSGVDSMSQYLSENQAAKLELVQAIKNETGSIKFAVTDAKPVDIPDLSQTLWSLQGYLGLAIEASQKEDPKIAGELSSLLEAIMKFRKEMLGENPVIPGRLFQFQHALFGDIRETFSALQTQDTRDRLRAEDLPTALRNRFIGVNGKYLLQVYPKKDVWQRENQKEFINELRTGLDPNDTGNPVITGTPIQLYEYTTLLKQSYEQSAWYALIAIAILVFLQFRSLLCVVLALLPVAVGTIWVVGVMGGFGIPFNPANIMTLPLVVGIGVTNGIQILTRFAEEQNTQIFGKSTGKAILISGFTTTAGFGSLILAKHQGIASLGFVMSVGVVTCMVAGLTFLPALLTILIHRGWRIKKPSDDMHMPTLGSEEPR